MYKVMLVDDEKWMLKTAERIFHWEDYGFLVCHQFTDAQQALEALKENSVDVLVLDICMPGLSGIDMLEKIRRFNKQLKIIILSGYSRFEFAQAAIKYDVFEYCLKPISEATATEVVSRLKEVLDSENASLNIQDDKSSVVIENIRFNEMIKYINLHYCEKLYLNELTEKFKINLTYCCLLFKKHFGCTFNTYITEYRMKQAVVMLTEEKLDIDEIAEYLNYDYVYFNKLFKKKFGKTPRQFRIESMNGEKTNED